ncbi:hypothetical protein WJ542_25925 [Paraburkholderia sp. B3]|uniref:hypothetical protein n=1 Tax=Paraburkholderia sp. B3 TaxID=3134791 RepID=UPI003981B76B
MQQPLRIERVDEDGRRGLRLTVGDDVTLLDGEGVEALIEQLALYRSAMKPPIPDTMQPRHNYHVALDPCWYAEPARLFDATVVFFRHEGLGWTGHAFDDQRRRRWLGELRAAVRAIEGKDRKGAKPC